MRKSTHRDLCTREAGASIQADTITTGTTVNFNSSDIRLEVGGSIFGGDTTLNGVSSLSDMLLLETKVMQSCTTSNLDLSRNDVDTSDLLYKSKLWSSVEDEGHVQTSRTHQ